MAAVLKRWTGSAWEVKPLKFWDGSAWVTKPLKYWNGSAWVGPAAATTFADNFDRTAASLEASPVASGGWSWTHDGLIAAAMALLSGTTLRSNTTDSTGSAYKTPSVGSADHYVQYSVPSTALTISTGPFACCRLADRSNFVGIRAGNGGSNGQVEVFRRVSGSLTSLYISPAGTVVADDVIRLECQGTNFTVKKNGVVLTGPTAIGSAGLNNVGTGVVARTTTSQTFDNFEAGAL